MSSRAPLIIGRYRAALGESPLWDHRRSRLVWCDILERKLLVHEGNETRTLHFAGGITAIGLASGGGYVATSERRFLRLDDGFAVIGASEEIEPAQPDNRFNDGKVDGNGRFWAGTMQHQCKGRDGSFYRWDGVRPEPLAAGFGCTNGPAFSPDGHWVYFTDSNDRQIWRAGLQSGISLKNAEPFARFSGADGSPDGMTIDTEGRLYVGHFGGGRISRYRPDGKRDAEFYLPATNITSVTFGGADFATLYATSAHCTLSDVERADRPDDGGLFALDVGAHGLPQPEFQPVEDNTHG